MKFPNKSHSKSQWNPTKILVNTIKSYEIILNHTKTWCRASEGAPAVVTFQTFYTGDHKTLKNIEKRNFSIRSNFIIIIIIITIITIIIIIIYISITIHLTPALRSGSA